MDNNDIKNVLREKYGIKNTDSNVMSPEDICDNWEIINSK